jgi:hypothetical protein
LAWWNTTAVRLYFELDAAQHPSTHRLLQLAELWIWGGWDHRTLYNDMYCIDLAELEEGNLTVVPVEQGGDVPSARHGHCAAVYDEKMIVRDI